jgi:type I restriction enzyme S subunit
VKTQRAIGQVLGALDDKIELNRRMSDTLEAMARALFQSWFVDFDPVHAKKAGRAPVGMDAETAALFPDRFEDSPLGPIPAGWKVGSLGAFLNVELGGDWGEDNQFEESIQVVTLRGVDLEHLRSQGSATAPRRWIKHASLAKRRLRGNDILIATSGAGPCGRALWVSPYLEPAFDLPVVYSNFCKRLSAKSSAYAAYFDRVLFGMHQTDEIWEYVNGTSIPNLEIHSLLSGKCTVVPPHSVLERFVNFLSPIYQRLYSTESRILTVIRDSLLPRLLSGELRVPEAEAIAEAAT